ncbi:MAG: hypothetical protein V1862_07110 [Methanobacteriota archaeon]
MNGFMPITNGDYGFFDPNYMKIKSSGAGVVTNSNTSGNPLFNHYSIPLPNNYIKNEGKDEGLSNWEKIVLDVLLNRDKKTLDLLGRD